MADDLTGRRALVTGASSGIGAATARALAARGADVALVARREEELTRLAEELGGIALPTDVTDDAALERAVDAAADALGGLDCVCAIAGAQLMAPFGDGRVEEWRRLVELNLWATITTAHLGLRHLRAAGGGDLVVMGSVAGTRVTGSEGAVYTATKFAVRALAEALRGELRDYGVRVLHVAPGWVRTGLGADMGDEDIRGRIRDRQAEIGLDPAVVGEQVAAAVALAPPAMLHELVVQSLDEA